MNLKSHIFFFIFIVINSISFAQTQDTLKTIVAKKGDGIYRILKEYGYPEKDYYNIFLELNKNKIRKDNSLMHGETYYLPFLPGEIITTTDTITTVIDSIKSELQFADTIKDDKLKGAIIYLISGHGGPDPGAVATIDGYTVSEDEYAYDICMRIAKKIEGHGGKVYMIINDPNDGIREDKYLKLDYDEYCYPDLEIPKDHMQRLKQRVEAVNTLYKEHKNVDYQRVLDIHIDSRSNGTRVDVFFYHCEVSKTGKKFAESIQKVFNEKYAKHQPARGYKGTVSSRELYVIRKVIPAAILIELGNIQNTRDQKRFLDPNNRQALANWITEGIIEDYKNQ